MLTFAAHPNLISVDAWHLLHSTYHRERCEKEIPTESRKSLSIRNHNNNSLMTNKSHSCADGLLNYITRESETEKNIFLFFQYFPHFFATLSVFDFDCRFQCVNTWDFRRACEAEKGKIMCSRKSWGIINGRVQWQRKPSATSNRLDVYGHKCAEQRLLEKIVLFFIRRRRASNDSPDGKRRRPFRTEIALALAQIE